MKTLRFAIRYVLAEMLVLLALLAGPARAYQEGDFIFNRDGATAWLWGYVGPGGAVVIPDRLGNLPVATIDSAFSGRTDLTSVTIPSSVTSIRGAFSGCTGLTSVTIPSSVRSISDDAFSGCTGLRAIEVDSLNLVYSSAEGVLFDKAKARLFVYPTGKAGPYTIPNSVTSIGNYAFSGCAALTDVTIPDRVTSIGDNAFFGCTGLTNVMIPNGVTSIGERAFSGCTGLTGVTIPNSVTSIGNYAFSGCAALTDVTIPNGVTSIGWYAFHGCTGLTSVTIPKSVTSMGVGAFAGCKALKAIEVDSLNLAYSSVEGVVFNKAQSELIAYPAGRAGPYTIPNSVTFIVESAFGGCTGLTGVTIPNSVTGISWFGFSGCTGLTSVTLPDSVTGIRHGTFSGCTGLTSINLPTSLSGVGDGAFSGCTGLTSVTIPSSVIFMGAGAFSGCTGLMSAYFEGSAPETTLSAFGDSPFVTVFHRAGAAGWNPTFMGRPTAVWMPRPAFGDWAVSTSLAAQFPNASAEGDDPDGDGFTNGDEWFAATDPTQRASRLELEPTARPADLSASDQTGIEPDQHAVYFRSVPGRYYGVQRATSLGGAWEVQATKVAAATQTRFVLPKPVDHGFYRVLALP